MDLRTDQAGGWEVVRSADRPGYEGVELVGYRDRAGQGLDMRVLPELRLTIVLVIDGELRIDRTPLVAAGIASGVGVNSVPVRGRDLVCVDIHLSPLAAHSVLDGAVAELAGTVVSIEDLWGARPAGFVQHWRAPTDGKNGSANSARRSPRSSTRTAPSTRRWPSSGASSWPAVDIAG
jgi:hypothetical protein